MNHGQRRDTERSEGDIYHFNLEADIYDVLSTVRLHQMQEEHAFAGLADLPFRPNLRF